MSFVVVGGQLLIKIVNGQQQLVVGGIDCCCPTSTTTTTTTTPPTSTTYTPPPLVCPSGQECIVYVEGKLDYCELVNGAWIRFGGGVCGCGNGLDESVIYDGPMNPDQPLSELNPRIKTLRCTAEAPADYATCCDPNRPNDAVCQALQALLPSIANLTFVTAGSGCESYCCCDPNADNIPGGSCPSCSVQATGPECPEGTEWKRASACSSPQTGICCCTSINSSGVPTAVASCSCSSESCGQCENTYNPELNVSCEWISGGRFWSCKQCLYDEFDNLSGENPDSGSFCSASACSNGRAPGEVWVGDIEDCPLTRPN